MSPEAENEALRAELGAAHALMKRMAARLDELEPKPAPRSPITATTVEWRGSSRDYFANAAEINRSLARELFEAPTQPEHPESPQINRIRPANGPSEGASSHANVIDATEGTSDARTGSEGQAPPDDPWDRPLGPGHHRTTLSRTSATNLEALQGQAQRPLAWGE